ncbi:MAG: nucleotidyltransferase domain-containing protein [Candidatus Aenigmarchaeota archaeon]|nr:nucleotidyltransferase domain-containing protein [Candidatus Aenigmarchaeota archaeon]
MVAKTKKNNVPSAGKKEEITNLKERKNKTVKKEKEVGTLLDGAGKKTPEEQKKMTEEEKKKRESQEKRFKIATDFSKELIIKFKKSVKSVIVYGSTATGTHKETSDIDVFVVMDDTKVDGAIPQEVKDRIWNEMLALAKKTNDSHKLKEGQGITLQAFMFLTEFWENMRVAEPVLMAILRNGVPVFDVGVFMPAKRMLQRGKIPTTKEAVDQKMHAAPEFVKYALGRIKSSGHYMEQAMATAGNAALMFIGRMPQNKEDVPTAIKESFCDQKLLEERFAVEAQKIRDFAKKLEHIKDEEIIGLGAEVDSHLKMTDEFVKRMANLIKELDQKKKGSVLMNTYKTFLKADVGALKYIGIKPPESLQDLPTVMHEKFPQLKDLHKELFDGLTKYLLMIKDGKESAIPERNVYELREKTKMFVLDLGKHLKDLKDKGIIKNKEDHSNFVPEMRDEKKKE